MSKSLVTCALPWKIAAHPPITTKSTPVSQRSWMTRSKFMLLLFRQAAHRRGGARQTVHSIGAIGRREFELLDQQTDIHTKLAGEFHFAARLWIL